MNYLIFDTIEHAATRSAQEAAARGCSGATTHWWSWRETAGGKIALILGDDIAEGSTDVEPEWPALPATGA